MKKNTIRTLLCIITIISVISLSAITVFCCAYTNGCTSTVIKYDYCGNDDLHLAYCEGCEYPIGYLPHETFVRNFSGDFHWMECEDCGYSKDEETHTFGWDSNILMHWQECEECGYSTATELHNFIWRTTSTAHCQVCTECGYITQEEAHTPDKWGTCTVCGDELSEGFMSIIPVAK